MIKYDDITDTIEDLDPRPNFCYGYNVIYEPDDDFPVNTKIDVWLYGADKNGNTFKDSITFKTVATVSDSDIWAPCLTGWSPSPGASGVSVDAEVTVKVLDKYGAIQSGVDLETIKMWIKVNGTSLTEVTDGISITEVSDGHQVVYSPSEPFPYSSRVDIIVDAEDFAGNSIASPTETSSRAGDGVTFWTEALEPVEIHVITGVVYDAEGTSLLENIEVFATNFFDSSRTDRVSTMTDTSGEFFLEVSDGKYALGARDTKEVYCLQFYDGRSSPLEADLIKVTSASPETLDGFKFALDSLHSKGFTTIEGTLSVDDTSGKKGDPRGSECFAVAVSSEEEREWVSSSFTDSLNKYYSLKVPNGGEYYVFAFSEGSSPEYHGGGAYWADAQAVGVDSSGEAVTDVNIQLFYLPDELSGEIAIGGTICDGSIYSGDYEYPPLRGAIVLLTDLGEKGDKIVASTFSDNDGVYSFENVPEGVYRIEASKVLFKKGYEYLINDSANAYGGTDMVLYILTSDIEEDEYDDERLIHTTEMMNSGQNYPNPFKYSTSVRYTLSESAKNVELSIYDVTGERVETLYRGAQGNGNYVCIWTPDEELYSGIYFFTLKTDNKVKTIRMTYIR